MISLLNILCGVGLFLSGMSLMSESTLLAFGEKMKKLLSRLTGTKAFAVLTGTAVTGIVQSSSAVTVMTVGFVEAGLMTIPQATGIVLGANMGTTVTSLLIAFNFSDLAPLSVFIGTAIMLFSEKEKAKHVGRIFLGFGMLFLGLNTMSGAFTHLKDNEAFHNLIVACEGKLTGIAAGIIITALLQSSSAGVGILQLLCERGLVNMQSALYIILGQNIGTVFTAILSSLGKSKAAKQVAAIHLVFNISGSMIFLLFCEIVPLWRLFGKIGSPSMGVSLFHIFFNLITAFLLFPAYDRMIRLSERLVSFRAVTWIKRKQGLQKKCRPHK